MASIIQPSENKSESKGLPKAVFVIIGLLVFLLIVQSAAVVYFLIQRNPSANTTRALIHPSLQPQQVVTPSINNYRQSSWARDPFAHMARMDAMMNQLLNNFFTYSPATRMSDIFDYMPEMDLEEKGANYIVTVDLPGLEKDKINITVKSNLLTVQGVRQVHSENADANRGYYAQERSYGTFARSISLPGPVKEGEIKADYQNGVLTIMLPKAEGTQEAKKVTIQ